MATADAQFDPKRPGSTEIFAWDFSRALASNETIVSAQVTVNFGSGRPDSNMASMVSGQASIVGSKVTQLITGGMQGNTYLLRFTITTSLGQVIQAVGTLLVRD